MDDLLKANSLFSVRKLQCKDMTLTLGEKTHIMGILNVTPDSFSDGGRHNEVDQAVARAHQLAEEGADIIDIGGESTRPGAVKVSMEEELDRVVPVIEAIRRSGLKLPISIDTYKAEVARQALEAGAHMINDVWGLKYDADMAAVAADYQCPVIIMHNRKQTSYRHLIVEIISDLRESIQLAHEAGVRDEQILIDPGIGLPKTLEHNLIVMRSLKEFVSMGYPVVLGTSRKSMIQKILNRPAHDVIEGTAATIALGIAQGCQIMRVHDVASMAQAARMCDAIIKGESNG